MQIIAKTGKGFLIEATESEVNEIYSAISRPETTASPIKIGDKLPAYDYAATIARFKGFAKSHEFTIWKERSTQIAKTMNDYATAIEALKFEEL